MTALCDCVTELLCCCGASLRFCCALWYAVCVSVFRLYLMSMAYLLLLICCTSRLPPPSLDTLNLSPFLHSSTAFQLYSTMCSLLYRTSRASTATAEVLWNIVKPKLLSRRAVLLCVFFRARTRTQSCASRHRETAFERRDHQQRGDSRFVSCAQCLCIDQDVLCFSCQGTFCLLCEACLAERTERRGKSREERLSIMGHLERSGLF